ncbi:MAG TPA: nuclear transport factor 2 family protein [Thermoleophilaceae bacterium]
MDEHPFRAAWRTRDVEAWAAALAPGVELRSPILTEPFRGREAVAELYAVLFEAIGEMTFTDELESVGTHAFFWHADVRGRRVEGADILRTDDRGQIVHIAVMIRPLVDIAEFAAAVAPPLAARRGRLRAAPLRPLILLLRGVLGLADRVASRVARAG